jgi:hypothetical protein
MVGTVTMQARPHHLTEFAVKCDKIDPKIDELA